jgi:NADPH-dependent 2,4-dienoyl-CoA reductase/sulfur reductase-like enzyme
MTAQRERLVVLGGVAAGMSAASQAKRRRPDLEVVAIQRSPEVSYGACGMPYNIMDPQRSIDDLVVISADTFRKKRGIDVRTRHEALAIEPAERRVLVRDLVSGREERLAWDHLVIATGARAIRLPIPGDDLQGVLVLRDLEDGGRVRRWLDERAPRRAVIVGGGYIGMEMAEALVERGLAVTVLERLPAILPGFEGAIVASAMETLVRHGVDVRTGVTATGFVGDTEGRVVAVETDLGRIDADLVLVAVGARPNAELARAAGLALGASGAIAVDDHLRTSAPGIWAAGDCAHAWHLVTGQPAWIPLGTTANKQGKIAGANAAGAELTFPGIVGTAIFRVFDLEVGRTGLNAAEAAAAGFDAVSAAITGNTRAHGYPGPRKTTVWLLAERTSGRLLGAQVVGGEGVKGRVDVLATALHARMDLDAVGLLDLSYAPPFAPVWDPVLTAASQLAKALGRPE